MRVPRHELLLFALLVIAVTGACSPAPAGTSCSFSAHESLTVHRLPDGDSDVFGTMAAGETHAALAWTETGWLGFDPGVAQAANIGLARYRWVQLDASVSPSCLGGVPLVTLAEVEADLAASGG